MEEESHEISLLDRVLLRLAHTSSSSFSLFLRSFLIPTLHCASSVHGTVKEKTVKIAGLMVNRIDPVVDQLDTLAIATECCRADSSVLEWTLALRFLRIGFELPHTDRAVTRQIMTKLLQGNGARPDPLRCAVFALALDNLIADLTVAPHDCSAFLTLPDDIQSFVELATHVLLASGIFKGEVSVQGLSPAQGKRPFAGILTGDKHEGTDSLVKWKLGLVTLFASGSLSETEWVVLPLLIAAADTNSTVSFKADQACKKFNAASYESPRAVAGAYALLNINLTAPAIPGAAPGAGASTGSPTATAAATTPGLDDNSVRPIGAVLLTRLVTFLTRSIRATESMLCIQITFYCLFRPSHPARVMQAGMAFLRWILTHIKDKSMTAAGPVLLSGLNKLLLDPTLDDPMRGFAFSALAQLIRRFPQPFIDSTDWVARMFANLAQERESENRLHIHETLSALLAVYATALSRASAAAAAPNKINLSSLLGILEQNAEIRDLPPNSNVRLIAVQWARQLFPADNVFSRYICLLGAADPRADVAEEGQRGLQQPHAMNAFDFFAHLLTAKIEFVHQVRFAHNFFSIANTLLTQNPPAETPQDTKTAYFARSRALLAHMADAGLLELLHTAVMLTLTNEHKSAAPESRLATESAAELLLTLVAIADHGFAARIDPAFFLIDLLTAGVPPSTKEIYARLLSWAPQRFRSGVIAHLLQASTNGTSVSPFSGTTGTSTGNSAEQLLPIGISSAATRDHASQTASLRALGLLNAKEHTPTLLALLAVSDFEIATAAAEALGFIAMFEPAFECTHDIFTLLDRLRKGDNFDGKKVERTAHAIGLSMHGKSDKLRADIATKLFALSGIKGDEIQFAIGEALAYAGAAPLAQSTQMQIWNIASLPLDFASAQQPAFTISSVLDRVLTLMATQDQSLVARCSIAIWLLCLTKFGGPAVVQRLPDLQVLFLNTLMDSNETTQEVSSKGLGLCYDLGDTRLKDTLVNALVDQLSGKASATRPKVVAGDGELQVELNIPLPSSKGATEKLSTYRELCVAATDMGQPDLIYKFLDMAGNQAVWNSKRGAAFGFSGIMKRVRSSGAGSMDTMLKDLIPKLFRYQYDPNVSIQTAMAQMWKEMVPDPKTTIAENLPAIVKELVDSSVARLWRVREAGLTGMADLLQSRDWNELQPYLETLWTSVLRAVDDIKDTVRTAAGRACEAVGKFSVKMASKAAPIVVPLLIREGIESHVEDRVKIGMKFLVQICKEAGSGLAPVVAEAAGSLLENMSSLEDQSLNYLAFHAGESADALDKARLQMSSGSPVAEALDLCVRQLTDAQLPALLSKMTVLVRQGVGLPTKGAVARLAVRLAFGRNPSNPDGAIFFELLRAFGIAWLDRSVTVRSAYCESAAALCRIVPMGKELEGFIDRALKLYNPWGDTVHNKPEARMVSAEFFSRFCRVPSDNVNAFANIVLPIAALGTQDELEDIAKTWSAVWTEMPGGGNVPLFKSEILSAVTTKLLPSLSYAARVQGAKVLSKVLLGHLNKEETALVLTQVTDMLASAYWAGKEELFAALRALTTADIREHLAIVPKLLARAVNACRSENVNRQYLATTLQSVAAVVDKLREEFKSEPEQQQPVLLDSAAQQELWEVLKPVAFPDKDPLADDQIAGADPSAEASRGQRRVTQQDIQSGAIRILAAVLPASYPGLAESFSRASRGESIAVRTTVLQSGLVNVESVLQCLGEGASNAIRSAAVSALEKLPRTAITESEHIRRTLTERIAAEREVAIRDRLKALLP